MKALPWILVILLCLAACRSIEYVPVETIRIEYKTRDSIRYDSIYKHDSIFYQVKGDSIYKYVKQMEYRYIFINRRDTVLKTDSIQVPYPVEKELSRWQAMKIELGGWAFGIIIAFALIVCIWIVIKKRKAAE
nr:MAG TPA: hypothetical protein [Caudoviricetes sp.]